MQSSSPPRVRQQSGPQHSSPQRGAITPRSSTQTPIDQDNIQQQHIPALSRDTTPVASLKPSTPPSSSPPQPLTPPDSASRATPPAATAISTGSTLSATAPQFRTRLIDAPIDLAGLGQPTDASPPLQQKVTMESGGSDLLDFIGGMAAYNDGRTPTQESFPPLRTPSMSGPSPSLSESAGFPTDMSTQPSTRTFSSSSSQASSDDFRTPNVYINGLPPNFPEDQLLAMTCEFGEVISVRTFTRHVSEKPSGYGFVLFSTVDAAEKCIESLRKYRNLHPSFSKQVHKIPGTAYANTVALPPSATDPPDSFKAKMERLRDTGSTNLYMEGLPLTIDLTTLQALVNPFKIMSSRLFQTRLSDPPRIIAFVRLESRQAAEEIIERLHGRMVRGWNDTGSRISVRFADTAEQRELRRTERMSRDGENSPARLTMAQAALLNLKGTQLHPGDGTPPIPSPNFGMSPQLSSNVGLPVDPYMQASLPPPIGLHNQSPLEEYPALRNSVSPFGDGLNSQAADYVSGLRIPTQTLGQGLDRGVSSEMAKMQLALAAGSASRAHEGFTPMERMLLQAHEQRQRGSQGFVPPQQPGFSSQFNVLAPEFNPAGGRLNATHTTSRRESGRRLVNPLPTMTEEDFHATGGGHRQGSVSVSHNDTAGPSAAHSQGVSRLSMDMDSRLTFTRQRNLTHAEARAQAQADAQAQALHTRSTTLPSHYLNADRSNGQAFLPTRSSNYTVHTTTTSGGALNARAVNDFDNTNKNTSLPRTTRISNNSLLRSNTAIRSNNPHLARENVSSAITPKAHITNMGSAPVNQLQARIDTTLQNRKAREAPRSGPHHDADDEDEGSGLDSPALSYSASVRTPASLSPATPFSAFGETFEGPPMAAAVAVSGAGGEIGLGMGMAVGGGNGKGKMRAGE